MPARPPFDPARVAPARAQPDADPTLTPRQVNELVQGAIARQIPATLHVVGEIGELSRPGSGHWYFTLKDATSELRCVMWRSSTVKIKFEPQSGLSVIASGGLEVYTPRGTYQLVARRIEPRGLGALELAFRQLRQKLEAAGLFAPERKRPLPRLAERIAVVTSPSGAALHDILRTFRRRFPAVDVLLFPVRVQGDGAADEIARAIELLNQVSERFGGIDAAIVGRGGGSLEDLWAFNEEVVARAIFASRVPIVSAVGHEVDVTIADLVADVRAATPTAAAELLTPDRARLGADLAARALGLGRALGQRLRLESAQLRALTARESIARPERRLRALGQRLDELARDGLNRLVLRTHEARRRSGRTALRLALCVSGGTFVRLRQRLGQAAGGALREVQRHWRVRERALLRATARVERGAPRARLALLRQHLAQAAQRLQTALRRAVERRTQALEARRAAVVTGDPRRLLGRGYSITRDARSRRILRSIREIRDGQRVITTLSDGEFRATADDPRQPGLFG